MIVSADTATVCYQLGNMMTFLVFGLILGFMLGIAAHFFLKKDVVE
jgi:hypothetical protein